jgi:hypothetical protein
LFLFIWLFVKDAKWRILRLAGHLTPLCLVVKGGAAITQ